MTQISAIEDAIALPAFQDTILSQNPDPIFQSADKNAGMFMGYDFHITAEGARLIEINSNAGGAFIVDAIKKALGTSEGKMAVDIIAMFEQEWTLSGRTDALRTIAIVDTAPREQYHYPDMCLARAILESHGFRVVIADPADLTLKAGHLYFGNVAIDMIYNRLTDFDLTKPDHRHLREALINDKIVLSPAPRHHALYANKRNLITLSDHAAMKALGASGKLLKDLSHIPETIAVTPNKAETLWRDRRHYFFKPHSGFGGRAVYRGAKLTKTKWSQILAGDYIAQRYITPPVRGVKLEDGKTALKFDLRVYTYRGKALGLAARIYQGQTTNLRTEGGGLAPVVVTGDRVVCC